MRLRTMVILPAVLMLMAAPLAAQRASLSDFAWLSGTRRMVADSLTIEEGWTEPASNVMLGVSRTLRGGRVVAFEFLRIQARGDTLYYIAQPNGAPPTSFRLTKWDGMEAVFANPQHDFPKRISYRKLPDGAVKARVDGGEGVAKGAEEFVFVAAQRGGYPSRPRPLPEAEEIALAMSAAPEEVSSRATIYVLGATGPTKVREGTNGCTCMVSRDLHEGSLYPICYDQEATKSVFQQELMELRLRFEGKSETEVKAAVAAAYAAGRLRTPTRPAISYMMSSRQVLFSSPLAEGRRVGAWHPHLMISLPYASHEQFGLVPNSSVEVMQLDRSGEAGAQLIVPVPRWSDSSRAPDR